MEKDKIICNHCGKKVCDDLKLCSFCGHKLSKDNEKNITPKKNLSDNNIIKNVKEKISGMDKNKKADILIISIFVIVILIMIISANNTYMNNKKNNENNLNTSSVPESNKEVLEITNNENYTSKMTSIMQNAVVGNKYFMFQSGYTHTPYLEYTYYSTKKYSKEIIKEQAKLVSQNIMKELQKYDYKKGSIFVMNFEYINLHFYGYDDLNRPSRSDGAWVQFDVTKINSQGIGDIIVQ